MYERLLHKQNRPQESEILMHVGDAAQFYQELDLFLCAELGFEKLLRFPYGNHYGWGYRYSIKNKYLFDLFPESGAFTIMIRLSTKQMDTTIAALSIKSQQLWKNRYPCGDGGWLNFRVLSDQDLEDCKKIIKAKIIK